MEPGPSPREVMIEKIINKFGNYDTLILRSMLNELCTLSKSNDLWKQGYARGKADTRERISNILFGEDE